MPEETAVIVGVGTGLGSALVKTFSRQGYTVFAAARRASALADLSGAEGDGRVIPVDCDATNPGEVERLFETATQRNGRLGVTIYNAGTYERSDVVDTEPADFERCWRIGCFGGFLVGRTAARVMMKRGEGTILFTGATASLRGGAGFANLASPKFALRAVAQSMARELGPKGIHVAHVIIDGRIRSSLRTDVSERRVPDSVLEPDAIANAYLALHLQHRSAWTHELDLRPWAEKF